MLAPRLNAAGRLGDAGRALELLLTEDTGRAHELADLLDRENRSRQKIDAEILDEAVEKVMLEVDLEETGAIVLESPRWHRGVVGIVASRIVERFGRPAVLLAREDDMLRGSGRSVPGFDLAASLDTMSELFLSHGGHPMAVGVSRSSGGGSISTLGCGSVAEAPSASSARMPRSASGISPGSLPGRWLSSNPTAWGTSARSSSHGVSVWIAHRRR
jgi:single-stranded-DNA-specific exonuclease